MDSINAMTSGTANLAPARGSARQEEQAPVSRDSVSLGEKGEDNDLAKLAKGKQSWGDYDQAFSVPLYGIMGAAAGGIVGAVGGAGVGAHVGGPVGAIVGATVGAVVGGIAGIAIGVHYALNH